jgi:hypothetical protein
VQLAPALGAPHDRRRLFDCPPLGAALAGPLFEVSRTRGRLRFTRSTGSNALDRSVGRRPVQRLRLARPALAVLDERDRLVRDLVVEPQSVALTTYATHFPSGEICGSPTFFSRYMSPMRRGRLAVDDCELATAAAHAMRMDAIRTERMNCCLLRR